MGSQIQKIKFCKRKKNNLFLNNKKMMIQMNYEDAIMTGEDFILEESELATLPTAEYRPVVQVKQERASPYPAAGRRPGKKPARRDSELSPVELDRLERRRERNRHAAARCRERRMNKIDTLESEVNSLAEAKQQLLEENQSLQREIEKLRFQLNLQNAAEDSGVEQEDPVMSDPFPAITKLENLGGPKTAVLFTPGGNGFQLSHLGRSQERGRQHSV